MRRPLMLSTYRERMEARSGISGRAVMTFSFSWPGKSAKRVLTTLPGHPRLFVKRDCKDVDARDKPGHGERGAAFRRVGTAQRPHHSRAMPLPPASAST